jgi:hypothetical protein
MSSEVKLIQTMKRSIGGNNNIPLITAVVKSVDGDSCTVLYGADDNATDLVGIRLKATIGGTANYLLVTPKVGSTVMLGSVSGDHNDLCVVKVDEIEKIELKQNDLDILIDCNDSKVSVKSGGASLYDLFNQLAQILNNLKVFTPSGVSGTPIPDTTTKVAQFENDFKQLLKA